MIFFKLLTFACCIVQYLNVVKAQSITVSNKEEKCAKSLQNTLDTFAKFDGCSLSWSLSGGGSDDPYDLKAVYFNYRPYIYEEGGTAKGILVDLFDTFLKQVCENGQRRWTKIKWNRINVNTMDDLIVHCKGSSKPCHFAMPFISFTGEPSTAAIQTSKIHSFPGFALVRHKVDQVAKILKSLGGTFKNLWPIFYISMAAAFLSGYVVWLLERSQNEEDFPKTFRHGAYEAFWWSYISMTTVGYGDKAPITILGRLFAVFWILFGIALIGIITSVLSNAITEGSVIAEIEIRGNTFGCLKIMPAAKSVIQIHGGNALCRDTIEEVERDFALGYISGIVMDTIRLQYFNKLRFKKLGEDLFVYQSAISYTVQEYSLGFWNIKSGVDANDILPAKEFRECMDYFQKYNKGGYKSEEENVKSKKEYSDMLDSSIISVSSSSDGVSILDPESDDVIAMILYITLIIFLVILFGLAYDLWCYYKDRHRNESRNAGYVETAEEKASNHLNPEERGIVAVVDRTMRFAEEKMQETEKEIKNEIAEMSRLIRRELATRRKQDTAYPPIPMNNLYAAGFPGYPYHQNNAYPPRPNTETASNLSMTKPKSYKNMNFQY